MEDAITIVANLSTKGFEKGSKALKSAISSLSRSALRLGKTAQQSATGVIGNIKKLVPTIIGVGSAFGVISKAVSAFMAQNELLSKRMSSVWTALGNLIGPIVTQLVNWVTTAVSYLLSFLKLLGVTGKTASQLSKSAKGAGSDLQKTIAGFDELNVLQDNSGGGSGDAGLKDIEPTEWMKALSELLKKGLWEDAGKMIAQRLNEMVDSVDWAGIGKKIAYYFNGALTVLATIIKKFNWQNLGRSFAKGVNEILNGVNWQNLGVVLMGKLTALFGIITGFLAELDWGALAKAMSDTFIGAVSQLSETIRNADFRSIGEGIRTFFMNIDWNGILEAVKEALQTMWNGALDFLRGLMGSGEDDTDPWIVTILEKLGGAIEKVGTFVSEHGEAILTFVTGIGTTVAALTIGEKVADFVKGLKDVIGTAGTAKGALKALFSVLSANPIVLVIALIAGLVAAFITAYQTNDEFREKVDTAFNKIKEVIGSVVDWVKDKIEIFKEAIQTAKDRITEFRDSVVDKFESIKERASSLIQKIKEVFSFEWKIPHISLPHITVTWEPTGDFARFLGVTALPHLGIEWYAKGGIVDGAHLIGAGEDGKEAIVPLERNTEWINMVAQGLLDRMESGEYSLSKIGQSIAALNNIAETVAFKMPAVAQGSILPYSVAETPESNSPSDDVNAIMEAIRDFYGKLDEIIYLLDHVQFVAQFGDLRALARKITQEQRREQISEGR